MREAGQQVHSKLHSVVSQSGDARSRKCDYKFPSSEKATLSCIFVRFYFCIFLYFFPQLFVRIIITVQTSSCYRPVCLLLAASRQPLFKLLPILPFFANLLPLVIALFSLRLSLTWHKIIIWLLAPSLTQSSFLRRRRRSIDAHSLALAALNDCGEVKVLWFFNLPYRREHKTWRLMRHDLQRSMRKKVQHEMTMAVLHAVLSSSLCVHKQWAGTRRWEKEVEMMTTSASFRTVSVMVIIVRLLLLDACSL